jgi:hypothetical protein
MVLNVSIARKAKRTFMFVAATQKVTTMEMRIVPTARLGIIHKQDTRIALLAQQDFGKTIQDEHQLQMHNHANHAQRVNTPMVPVQHAKFVPKDHSMRT